MLCVGPQRARAPLGVRRARTCAPPRPAALSSLLAALVALGALGCGDLDRAPPRRDTSGEPALTFDAGPLFQACMEDGDGGSCGPGRHCLESRCVVNICGDGIVAEQEECDDGNEQPDDDCTPSCKRPKGKCGNGTVDPGEECDDANDSDMDFCTNHCLRQLCRNGVLDLSEECDDGNTDPRDGCSNDCQRIVCGDGMAEEQEECDDGNKRQDDGCSNQCTANVCGNGRIDPGEACDGRRKRSADDRPDGEPVAEGLNCAEGCKSIEDDRCKRCEEKRCPSFLQEKYGLEFDVVAGCRKVGHALGDYGITPDQVTDQTFVARCGSLMECGRRNRCDLYVPSSVMSMHDVKVISGLEALIGCFCGEAPPGSGTYDDTNCFSAPAGRCVQQYYDATDCTTGLCVEGNAVAQGTPSFVANYLSECHRQRCFAECR